MNWWNIIKTCCAACGNLNKGAGGVSNIAGSHDGKPPPKKNKALYNIKHGGDKDGEEIDS